MIPYARKFAEELEKAYYTGMYPKFIVTEQTLHGEKIYLAEMGFYNGFFNYIQNSIRDFDPNSDSFVHNKWWASFYDYLLKAKKYFGQQYGYELFRDMLDHELQTPKGKHAWDNLPALDKEQTNRLIAYLDEHWETL